MAWDEARTPAPSRKQQNVGVRFAHPHLRDQKTETADGVTVTYGYEYDPVGRLLTVTRDGVLTEEYRYEPNGTRNYEMNAPRGIAGRSLTYSDEDHLLSAGDTTYQHDEDGFLTTKTEGSDITIYDYSLRGELFSVTLPDGTQIEYLHDPLGRRIAKKINGTVVEKYLWQGMTRLLAVYDGNDSLLMRFGYADSRMPVAMTKDGVTYYLAYDQVGSLKTVSDASGNVVKKIEYDSFGNIISDTDLAFAVPFGFAGGLHNRDTGLVRFGYRDYDPDTGRWTAKDPILFAGGDTDLYGYCVSDPVNWVDSDGLIRGNNTVERHFWKNIMSGNFEEALQSLPHLNKRFVQQTLKDYGNSIVKELKKAGKGCGARSGQHGRPYKQAGSRLIREGNELGGEIGDIMKQIGKDLIEFGKGVNH